jgi:hypothetical protein
MLGLGMGRGGIEPSHVDASWGAAVEASGIAAGGAEAVAGGAADGALASGASVFAGSSHAAARSRPRLTPKTPARTLRALRMRARYHEPAAAEEIVYLRAMVGRLVVGVVSALGVLGAPVGQAGADAGVLRATLQCEHVATPGRVRCDAELRASHGTVRWADVEILETPDFLAPLKGRIGPRDASAHESDLWRWALGLVARDRGEGDVVCRVRAVVCDAGSCVPEEVTAAAHVLVGS